MSDYSQTRRTLLTRFLLSTPVVSLLSACGIGKEQSVEAQKRLSKLLRHHGVAAHLGRLNIESDNALKSLSKEQLTSEILDAISLTADEVNNLGNEEIRQAVDKKIREDFSLENVVTVDGWLLSQLEAKICALIFRNIENPNV